MMPQNFNYSAYTQPGGLTVYDNPMVNAYGGPIGLASAISGGNVNAQNQRFYQDAYAQQDAAARARGQGVPKPVQPQMNPFQSLLSGMGLSMGGQQPGGQPSGLQDYVNVTQGPVWSPQHVQGATEQMQGSRAAMPSGGGSMQSYLDDLMRGDMTRRGVDFNRQTTYQNAQHELEAGRTGAQLGAQRGRQDASQYAAETGLDTGVFATILDMLMGLMGK